MALFNKDGLPTVISKEKNTHYPKEISTILGEDTYFNGILSFDGAVRIDGKLKGEIISKGTLLVGEKSVIEADINVSSIVIGGRVIGNIIATNRLEMLANAEISGNIQTPVLKIEDGAIFQGACQMQEPDKETKSIPYVETKTQEVVIQHPPEAVKVKKEKAAPGNVAEI